jgi:hypothetical protein
MTTKWLAYAIFVAAASTACSAVEQTPPDRSYFYDGATRLGDPGATQGYFANYRDERTAPTRYRRLYRQ